MKVSLVRLSLKKRIAAIVIASLLVVLALLLMPRLRALGLIVRVAKPDSAMARLARVTAQSTREEPVRTVPTRHGPMDAQLFQPIRGSHRTTLLVPGVHMDGVREERLVGLARQLAATGIRVITVGPQALMRYRLSPDSTDQLEDAIAWAAGQSALAPDGRVDVMAFSFAGGLALVAAGREPVRDHVAAVLSFGGHADLGRVLRYLCEGTAEPTPPDASRLALGGEHMHVPRPHDYGAIVALLNLAPWMVPADQVQPLQDAVTAFLRATSTERLNPATAASMAEDARQQGAALPEPSRTLMGYVVVRDVAKLGRALAPMISAVELPAAVSPARSPLPTAPVFLLHGADDPVVPATEMLVLVRLLQGKTRVHALASQLVTHAEATNATTVVEMWYLAGFWRDLLRR